MHLGESLKPELVKRFSKLLDRRENKEDLMKEFDELVSDALEG